MGKVGDVNIFFLLGFSDKIIQFSKTGMSGTKSGAFMGYFL